MIWAPRVTVAAVIEQNNKFLLVEELMSEVFRVGLSVELETPFPVLSYHDAMMRFGIQRGRDLGMIQSGDVVVATAGVSRRTGSTNMIRVLTAED